LLALISYAILLIFNILAGRYGDIIPSPSPSPSHKKNVIIIAIAVAVPLLVIAVAITVVVLVLKRKKGKSVYFLSSFYSLFSNSITARQNISETNNQ
jgi:flagellar basal body-associated protein FliL